MEFDIGDKLRQDLERLRQALGDQRIAAGLRAAGQVLGVEAEASAPEYPPQLPPLPRRVMTKTKGLRLYARKPYRRTRKLGNSITSKVISFTANQVTVAIGAGVRYAPYVIGGVGDQTAIMARNWWRYPDVLKAEQDRLMQVAVDALLKELLR